MAEPRQALRLETGPGLRTVPLPLLFARLAILSAPAAELAAALEERARSNPLLTVEPPRATVPEASAGPTGQADEEEDPWEQVPAPVSLEEALVPQLALMPETALLGPEGAMKLCSCLDGRGYLAAPPGVLAASLGVGEGLLDRVLERAREIVDPAGLFARDLADCLLLQLSRQGLGNSDASAVLELGRDFLERGDMAGLKKTLGWDRGRIEAALAVLRRLDPHPGSVFTPARFILPELSIRFGEGGRASVRLLADNLPRVLLDAELLEAAGDGAVPFFTQARGILSALAARYRTKLRLGLALGRHQEAYLRGTATAPGPFTLTESGREVGLAPSTVQRAASATWAETPRGTLRLSSLLGRGLAARRDLSVRAVREMILAGWKAGRSDAAIARELGLPPRTVSWHRQKLGLPRSRPV